MLCRMLIMTLLLVLGISNALGVIQVPEGPDDVQNVDKGNISNILQVENESICQDVLKKAWIQYNEDVRYSSRIIDEFLERKITNREAMMATTSTIVLTSQTIETISNINPPDKYVNYHNYTINALEYFKKYLWCMSKFYETGDIYYSVEAGTNFNTSIYYYEQGIEESMLYIR